MYEKLIKYSSLIFAAIFLSACTDKYVSKIEVDSFSVIVVDSITQKPIEGALVVASFIARGGSHGSTVGLSNTLEAITRNDGIATFPSWATEGIGFSEYEPTIIAYVKGYMSVTSSSKSKRERKEDILYVYDIRPALTPNDNLPLTKCEKAGYVTYAECSSRAYSQVVGVLGPITEKIHELPLLNELIKEHR